MLVIGAVVIASLAALAGTGVAVAVAVAAQAGTTPSRASFPAAQTPDPDATPEPGGSPLPLPPAPEPTPLPPSATPTPEPTPVEGGTLAIGITEPNPSLIWPAGAHDVPAPFARWRDAVADLHPHFYRLQLDWAQLQPDPDTPIDSDRDQAGCMRDVLPCAPWRGLGEQLRALAARQAQGGWETVVTISGTPDWAAQAPGGCERPGTAPRSRAPRQDALPAYRRLVLEVLAAARETDAELRWWSAWNEPNHPYFLSPQRARCDVDAPSAAVGSYVELQHALGEALATAPGDQYPVLGDLSGGTTARKVDVTSVPEFVAALPRRMLCDTAVWAQHAYLAPRDDAKVAGRALTARHCRSRHEIWVTETGARNTARDPAPLVRCQSMQRRLRSWYDDPRISVAFQYSVREDDRFPYGLITPDLNDAYPVLGLWQAWGATARPSPQDHPPSVEQACVDTEPPPAG